MKCSLGISNCLEEISSLSHSVVFLYFFALIAEEGFLISPCYSLELCIQMLIRGSQAPRRAVCGTRGSLRTMHGGGSAPSCCAFTHRVAFVEPIFA